MFSAVALNFEGLGLGYEGSLEFDLVGIEYFEGLLSPFFYTLALALTVWRNFVEIPGKTSIKFVDKHVNAKRLALSVMAS